MPKEIINAFAYLKKAAAYTNAELGVLSPEKRDLIAWLSRLGGESKGAVTGGAVGAADFNSILHPKRGDWPTYYGNLSGNRYTTVDQITPANVAKLQMQWIYPIQYSPLETTPLVVDGVMYATGPNQVFAIDGRTGDEMWRYTRPRPPPGRVCEQSLSSGCSPLICASAL